jgi:hypothetical protein
VPSAPAEIGLHRPRSSATRLYRTPPGFLQPQPVMARLDGWRCLPPLSIPDVPVIPRQPAAVTARSRRARLGRNLKPGKSGGLFSGGVGGRVWACPAEREDPGDWPLDEGGRFRECSGERVRVARLPGSGKQDRLGGRCPRRAQRGHGGWYLALEIPAVQAAPGGASGGAATRPGRRSGEPWASSSCLRRAAATPPVAVGQWLRARRGDQLPPASPTPQSGSSWICRAESASGNSPGGARRCCSTGSSPRSRAQACRRLRHAPRGRRSRRTS